jgi:hypothetical protein
VVAYTHPGTTAVNFAYAGGVYSPTQNRIYFVPYGEADETDWYYVDCDTGTVVAYTHPGTTAVNNAYSGGVFSPTQNRIYFVPYGQAPQTEWHYIQDLTNANISIDIMSGAMFNKF